MKNIFYAILLLTLSINLFSQRSFEIDWEEPQTVYDADSNYITRLFFNDAQYKYTKPNLPLFVKVFDIDYTNYNLEILNVKYKELKTTESILINRKDISENIVFNHSVGKSGNSILLKLEIIPFKINSKTNKIEKLLSFDIILNSSPAAKNIKTKKYAANSVLSSGKWYKVKLASSGVYKITADEFSSMGFSTNNLNLNKVKLYGNGGKMRPEKAGTKKYDDLQQNAIEIHDLNNNGYFDSDDYFLFYAQGPDAWNYNKNIDNFIHKKHLYDDYAYYFLTVNNDSAYRIINQSIPSLTADTTINTFRDFYFYDKDSINLIKSGRVWYAREFDLQQSHKFTLNLNNLNTNKSAEFRTRISARSTSYSTMDININGVNNPVDINPISTNYNSIYAKTKNVNLSLNLNNGGLNIQYYYNKPISSAVAWLDYFELEYERNLIMNGAQMNFRSPESVQQGRISEFVLQTSENNLKIWDVTEHTNPKEISYSSNGNQKSFIVETDSLREFVAHYGAYKSVINVGTLENQNLHSLENIDYVIIYHSDFKSTAEEIKSFHEKESNLKIITLTQYEIFNEFSSGSKDVAAIRDFMKMLYDKAGSDFTKQPKYLLFIGDGSYDNKGRVNDNTNFILTFQSKESLAPTASFVSDDFFGLLDDGEGLNASGHLDIGIGRLPFTSETEAKNYLQKMYRYTNQTNTNFSDQNNVIKPMADWRNMICFVADDEDSNLHLYQSDFLARYVSENFKDYNVDKIFVDAFPQITVPGGERYPEAKESLLQRFKKGALIINYTGHGGETGLAHESILEVADILKMNNAYNLTTFVTATCEFSRFDDPERVSAGEHVFLNPDGGAIALLTTTRLAFAGANFSLNKALIENTLTPDSLGNMPCLGDLIKFSKVYSGSNPSNKNFILMGDPALMLSYPKYKVTTTKINNHSINQVDTLNALSKITISGEIKKDSTLLSNFNGIVYPTVYDKAQELTTLGNDGGSYPTNFDLQKNIIYKGKAEVKNGKFEFSFIIPKDIAYNYGFGKISYYAENGEIDANGYFDSIVIGGTNDSMSIDTTGPDISLFLNDTNFIFGGLTDENPILLSYVYDENGINTTGIGIGHDIVANLDSGFSIPLNDYYEADLNTYKSGKVKYPFSDLSEGRHKLKIKVWDIYNNSSEAYTEFFVSSSEQFVIENLYNYPNPFTESTSFSFELNKVATDIDIEIEIYNINGKLEKVLKGRYYSEGYQVGKGVIEWDGRNDNGHKLSNGVYIYRLKAKTSESPWITDSNKLVILK